MEVLRSRDDRISRWAFGDECPMESGNAYDRLQSGILEDRVDDVRRLLNEDPALVEIADVDGTTALFLPNSAEMTELLLQHGASPNARRKDGWSPLHMAAYTSKGEIAALLLAAGADVNVQADEGDSPLMVAAGEGDVRVARLLIEHGADVNVVNRDGFTPLTVAVLEEDVDVVAVLLSRGSDPNHQSGGDSGFRPLQHAAIQGNESLVRLLLKHGVDPCLGDRDGELPMDYAENDAIRRLLSRAGTEEGTTSGGA